MTIQRPSADDLIQTRLAATRHLAQSPEGSVSPDGFAWAQSYRQDVTALLARAEAAERREKAWYATWATNHGHREADTVRDHLDTLFPAALTRSGGERPDDAH